MDKLGCSYFSPKSGKKAKEIVVVDVCVERFIRLVLSLFTSDAVVGSEIKLRLGDAWFYPLRTCCWDVLIYHRIRGVHLLYKDQSDQIKIYCLCGMLLVGWSPVCWNISQVFGFVASVNQSLWEYSLEMLVIQVRWQLQTKQQRQPCAQSSQTTSHTTQCTSSEPT